MNRLSIGLILVSMAAGAPFLPKLVEVAKGNTPFSVGLMVLLMVVTIVYLPLVLPLVVTGVEVNPLDIARSLIIMMLIPLAIGLFIKARYEDAAEKIRPTFASASNIAILVLIVLGLVLNFESMIALIGSKGLLAAVLFIGGALIAGLSPWRQGSKHQERDGAWDGSTQHLSSVGRGCPELRFGCDHLRTGVLHHRIHRAIPHSRGVGEAKRGVINQGSWILQDSWILFQIDKESFL